MFRSEKSADEGVSYVSSDYNVDSAGNRVSDIASGQKPARPKVKLSAIVTCPDCGGANKPEWMNKSRHSDSYATTVYCEQCGSLIAIWATHVDAQIVMHSENSGL